MKINKKIAEKVKSLEEAFQKTLEESDRVAYYVESCLKWKICPECGQSSIVYKFHNKWFINDYETYNCKDIQCGFKMKLNHRCNYDRQIR